MDVTITISDFPMYVPVSALRNHETLLDTTMQSWEVTHWYDKQRTNFNPKIQFVRKIRLTNISICKTLSELHFRGRNPDRSLTVASHC